MASPETPSVLAPLTPSGSRAQAPQVPVVPRRLSVLALALLFGAPALAEPKADVAPPHGFVDPCSPGNHADANTHCELCTDAASCQAHERVGLELRCRRHAGDGEVWCTTDAAKPRASKVMMLLALSAALGLGFYLKQTWSRRTRPG